MIPGFTSTGSKGPEALFGAGAAPLRMTRAEGCRVWDEEGREYVDCIMALGAVALGYGHPDVSAAAGRAVADGVVGSLPPVLEHEVAERLTNWWSGVEGVRFLKTGAEAVSAAIRVARVVTARETIVACGYHGWLDGVTESPGVPSSVKALRVSVPFGSVESLRAAIDAHSLAALVVEPVVDGPPDPLWVDAVNRGARESGALLILDEIKSGIRLGIGGAARRYGFTPDLIVAGKALGNGFPIAAVLGPRDIMDGFTRTWISSTLATEFVSLAAARAVLDVAERIDLAGRLASLGRRLYDGLTAIAARHPDLDLEVKGIPEFCYLAADGERGARLARRCAQGGVLFKRNAYNFVSAAHDDAALTRVLDVVGDAVAQVTRDR